MSVSHLRLAEMSSATLAFAHLLAVLRNAADVLDEVGQDIDAQIVRAHVAQLEAGREWPGMAVAPVTLADGSTTGGESFVPLDVPPPAAG